MTMYKRAGNLKKKLFIRYYLDVFINKTVWCTNKRIEKEMIKQNKLKNDFGL